MSQSRPKRTSYHRGQQSLWHIHEGMAHVEQSLSNLNQSAAERTTGHSGRLEPTIRKTTQKQLPHENSSKRGHNTPASK
jgi:hypothetical protein